MQRMSQGCVPFGSSRQGDRRFLLPDNRQVVWLAIQRSGRRGAVGSVLTPKDQEVEHPAGATLTARLTRDVNVRVPIR
jgi:hypothetical protein